MYTVVKFIFIIVKQRGAGCARGHGRRRRLRVLHPAARAVERGLLGGGEDRRQLGVDAHLAGEPRRALRPLAERLEEPGQVGGIERLVLEELQDELVEALDKANRRATAQARKG